MHDFYRVSDGQRVGPRTAYQRVSRVCCSYLGACQLELDVLFTKTWLDSYVMDSSVRVLMTSHYALHYLDNITTLLKQQPSAAYCAGKGLNSEQRRDKDQSKNNNARSKFR